MSMPNACRKSESSLVTVAVKLSQHLRALNYIRARLYYVAMLMKLVHLPDRR